MEMSRWRWPVGSCTQESGSWEVRTGHEDCGSWTLAGQEITGPDGFSQEGDREYRRGEHETMHSGALFDTSGLLALAEFSC